jgi:AraC-like DNA-binding protein
MSPSPPAAKKAAIHLARSAIVGAGMVRVGPLMAIPAVLERHGVVAADLLAEFGLAPASFEDPENTMSFALVARLLGRCAERTGCEHFGLLVGEQAGPTALGAVGYLVLSSATVGAALEVLTAHLNVQDRGSVAAMRVDNTVVRLTYAIIEPGIERADQVYGISMAVGRNIMRGLCGPEWRPESVTLAFARPRDVEPYRRSLGVVPRFDEGESALIFPARTLDQPLPSADRMLNKLMEQRVTELEFRATTDIVERVRRLLRIMITSPDCSLAAVALRVGAHERTLKRHLADAGTTFQALRDEVRHEAACQLLGNTRAAIGEVATIVGYSDPSSFTRAFQRWSGVAPLDWRTSQERRRHRR